MKQYQAGKPSWPINHIEKKISVITHEIVHLFPGTLSMLSASSVHSQNTLMERWKPERPAAACAQPSAAGQADFGVKPGLSGGAFASPPPDQHVDGPGPLTAVCGFWNSGGFHKETLAGTWSLVSDSSSSERVQRLCCFAVFVLKWYLLWFFCFL